MCQSSLGREPGDEAIPGRPRLARRQAHDIDARKEKPRGGM